MHKSTNLTYLSQNIHQYTQSNILLHTIFTNYLPTYNFITISAHLPSFAMSVLFLVLNDDVFINEMTPILTFIIR